MRTKNADEEMRTKICGRRNADEEMWTRICGRGNADEDLRRRIFPMDACKSTQKYVYCIERLCLNRLLTWFTQSPCAA